ncbi:segregation and condensation protein A [Alkalihalobacillus alcalophilus ATCC 27647 = CGMCC 1.3604]|uniref:Segregation and condensation protein A n=1 Tax=Alkalihalobacillus alcalophilus ATCC 27647 = CGMCC 1.3604 TaxID=1218173 RepID=A0A094XIF8_ALKAL|nr:segregation/condensation protein A [Alkalihalobacillus alcalophilus]KGA98570.1 segregation and condensation protein A [Alkalihalobacillus alcalophilus ATCC 27647 = CGMCC 1.3604]MED1560411.1 segregation/condensation protein A [Alkalihalobacillus alcalophilus]THG89167.1 segregation and condensation protein A [Alkalihalobacillus alcalophilus ATCC 27647 = CGMCC 1.3604]
MSSYQVKLDSFEGPLDLLLHLINQAEVDIYDIPVAKITDQYLSYIHTMQEIQLDIASEYLVMAATLLAIKSKMLLPNQELDYEHEVYDLDEEDDPREELISRLVEYRKYKEAASDLKEKEEERSFVLTRAPEDLEPYVSEQEKRDITIQGVSLFDMLSAYQKLLKRQKLKAPQTRTVRNQEYSIEDRMNEVVDYLLTHQGKCAFEQLFEPSDRSQMVVTFLAILELMKTKAISCQQSENFSSIMIYQMEEETFRA